MMKQTIMVAVSTSFIALASCGPQAKPSTNPGGNTPAIAICPANQMQDLVGQSATTVSAALSQIPEEERTPSYFIGEDQQLPNDVTRGSTLVILGTPVVGQNPDLSAYTVVAVKCFTGGEWV